MKKGGLFKTSVNLPVNATGNIIGILKKLFSRRTEKIR